MRAYLREGPGRQEKPIKADLKGMSEFPEDSGQSEGCSWQRYDQRLGRERGRGGGAARGDTGTQTPSWSGEQSMLVFF